MNQPERQGGATLIEVLVAMFILAIGLLGLAGLQAMSVQSNQGAYYRSQATILASDIADRMRTNRNAALAGDYAQSSPPSTISASSGTPTPAQRDLAEWNNHLATSLPQGTGTIVTSSNIVTISISWNDARARIKSTDETTEQATMRAIETFVYRTRL